MSKEEKEQTREQAKELLINGTVGTNERTAHSINLTRAHVYMILKKNCS